jgi:hypothetical protein
MDKAEIRAALINFFEAALQLAKQVGKDATAYLIERALDEARAQTFRGVPDLEPRH